MNNNKKGKDLANALKGMFSDEAKKVIYDDNSNEKDSNELPPQLDELVKLDELVEVIPDVNVGVKLPFDLIEKVRDVSYHSRIEIQTIIAEALQTYVDKYENRYGTIGKRPIKRKIRRKK